MATELAGVVVVVFGVVKVSFLADDFVFVFGFATATVLLDDCLEVVCALVAAPISITATSGKINFFITVFLFLKIFNAKLSEARLQYKKSALVNEGLTSVNMTMAAITWSRNLNYLGK
jgi:hypothetical protein